MLYEKLDFPGALHKEDAIKKGRNLSSSLFPLGPTLIESAPACPISSVLIPLAAAVAAGNAVVVLLDPSVAGSNEKLRNLIRQSLDYEAVNVAPDASSETWQQMSSRYFGVAVLQGAGPTPEIRQALCKQNPTIRILEPAAGLPAVFVHRSASDLEAVAAHLRAMIVSSARRNVSRVPRLCFVDEFIIEKLEDLVGTSKEYAVQMNEADKESDSLPGLQQSLRMRFPATFVNHHEQASPAVIALNNNEYGSKFRHILGNNHWLTHVAPSPQRIFEQLRG